MSIHHDRLRAHPFIRRVRLFLRGRRGNIAAVTALLLVPLVTMFGVATQSGSWYLMQRAMQNAADSAVIAVATNGGNGGTNYATEGKAIVASYGFTDGTGNVHVTVPAPTTYAGTGICATTSCYEVKVTNIAPLYLLQFIGYTGNATTSSGSRGQSLTAGALATTLTVNNPICLIALGTGDVINGDGINSSSIACNIFSNGNSPHCNGHALTEGGWSDSVGPPQGQSNKSCGESAAGVAQQHGNLTAISDPYQAVLAANPPAGNPCSKYYPDSNSNWSTNGGVSAIGDPSWDGTTKFSCGDVKLTGNVTLTSASTVLVIENGQLDLGNFTLKTASGAGLTIIFTSPNPASAAYTSGGTPSSFISGNGTLDIAAPTSGTWSGLAILQNKNLPLQSITYTGNSPTFKITGVIDAPAVSLLAKGAVNKSSNGYSCFTLVVHDMTIKGTGDLFYVNPQAQCPQAGVSQILAPAGVIGKLVY